MCITCALHVHYMCITCALHVHYMCITCALHVHYMCITCALHVHYMCITCALHVHYMCITCALHVHYMCDVYQTYLCGNGAVCAGEAFDGIITILLVVRDDTDNDLGIGSLLSDDLNKLLRSEVWMISCAHWAMVIRI